MAAARDGSLQVGFGLGKYTNRNVIDAYGGISMGVEQCTVRASRVLAPDPDLLSVGPLHYEIVQPLKRLRVRLEPTNVQPIAFDIPIAGIVPPFLEEREDRRALHGYRYDAHQIRYHQTGTARGWVEVQGQRTPISPEAWVATRDHGWGIRQEVGAPLSDLQTVDLSSVLSVLAICNPVFFERPDGSRYAMYQYYLTYSIGAFSQERFQGGIEHPDGRREPFAGFIPAMTVDPRNRRLTGTGAFQFRMADSSERRMPFEVLSDTGFHLGTGLYHGLDGHYHGSYRGPLHLDGEHFPDCSDPATAARIHQIRDCLIRVQNPAGGGTAWGNCQTVNHRRLARVRHRRRNRVVSVRNHRS